MKKLLYGILAVLAALLLSACQQQTQEAFGYQINYVNEEGIRLVEESYTPEAKEGEALIQELLDRMRVPQYNGDYHSAIPDSVEIRSLTLAEKNVALDFNSAYYEMEALVEIMMRTAVVETLCQVPEVDSVTFTVEGEPLIDSMGTAVGQMNSDTFIDTKGAGINSYAYASLSLYFASPDGDRVVKEMRNVHYSTNTSLEKVVVEQLISGPVNQRLGRIAPAGTKILGVTQEDGVCTVNLDSTFNQAVAEGNVTPEAAIYAIVNALCDTCDIEKVQFQIDGESGLKFRDTVNLVAPFERNEDLILGVEAPESAADTGSSEAATGELEPSIGIDQVIKGGSAS
ncbi:MAG: GerMN domain-containing protein [Eubacteriales bacterium]|nr:GerMN domain-containing protein [Eubacteriales bacterium]